MSQYGKIYRIEFKNFDENTIRINISPTNYLISDAATPTVYNLQGSGTPLIISNINNDQDKFQPIRSKQAVIQFVSDAASGLDITIFSKGPDNLWKVDILCTDTGDTIFTGFLILDDNQQPFQPDPQIVELTATDHLGVLKDIPLTDDSGVYLTGKYKLGELIAYCLKKTGLTLDIYAVNNLRCGSGYLTNTVTFRASDNTIILTTASTFFYIGQVLVITNSVSNNGTFHIKSVGATGSTAVVQESLTGELSTAGVTMTDQLSSLHIYDGIYLDSKTFEREIGLAEDCYTVLEKILCEDCYIGQWLGNWWIMRIDEFEGNPIYAAHFDSDGVFDTIAAGTSYNKSIGASEDFKFANADTDLKFIRPHGYVQEDFDFAIPLEVPCNSDFSRGDLFSDISSYEKDYLLDCWTQRRGLPGAYATPITITDYIKRLFDRNNYETDRYIYLTPQTGHSGFSSTDDEYIESEAIPVNANDKFTASIQWKLLADIASSSGDFRLFRFILIGDDGTNWILGEDVVGDGIHKWFPVVFTGTPLNTGKGSTGIIFADQDETEWQTISWDAPAVPVGGSLYIWINQFYQVASTNVTVLYANLNFDLSLYINNSYQKYNGQRERVDRLVSGYLAKREKAVYMEDSPAKIFKGSMFFLSGSTYYLTRNWYAAAPFALGLNYDPTYLHPYGYIQVFSVWNQFRGYNDPDGLGMGINIFTGSVLHLTSDWPDLFHKYSLTDVNDMTNYRYFMVISFSQNWRSCISKFTLIEVYNTSVGKVYNDTHTFKYISSQ